MNSVKIIENGTVFARPDNPFGYNAWPSIALNDHGEIAVAFSGGRLEHVCPFGKAFVVFSKDEGRTWSSPIVAVDTPLDDRDPGILNIGNNKMLLTTFNNTTKMQKNWQPHRNDENTKLIHAYLPLVTQEIESKYLGSLISLSEDGGFSWSQPVKIPITAPHGPNLMKDGSIIYAGTPFPSSPAGEPYPIHIYKSDDCGKSFYFLSKVALCPEVPKGSYAEPHIAELANGRLVLHIRIDGYFDNSDYVNVFKTCQSVSDDKGKTWSTPTLIGMDGAPPHLLELSSGKLISTYGRRTAPVGIKVMISENSAQSFENGEFLWDEALDSDIGYPASIELKNGDILTVFYARRKAEENCSILWVRWRLDDSSKEKNK